MIDREQLEQLTGISRDDSKPTTDYGIYGSRPTRQNNKNFAAETRAYLNRQIYNDYLQRFAPHEDQLLDAITGEEMLNERLSAIRVNADNAFDATQATSSRALGRYGVGMDQREQNAQATQTDLSRSSAIASSRNQTRQHVHDRNMELISGASSARSAIPTEF